MLGKIVAFDDDTLFRLNELGRNRMATFQELADEAFTDLLNKHGVPIDLKDALRKSVKTIPKDKRRTTIADKSRPRRVRRPRGG